MLVRFCVPVEIYREVEVPDSASWDEIFNEGERQKMRVAIMLDGQGESNYEVCSTEWERLEDDEEGE